MPHGARVVAGTVGALERSGHVSPEVPTVVAHGRSGVAGSPERDPDAVTLDEVDWSILRALAANARISKAALAAEVGVAPSTCHLRLRRLRETGVIAGFRVDLSPELLGKPLQALVSVRLQAHARTGIGEFASRFAALPGVLNVYFLAGVNDFSIHVAARSPDSLREFVVRNLSASRDVASTETNLIFEHLGNPRGLV